MSEQYLVNAYLKLPINMVMGSGVFLYDDLDNQYLDFAAGVSVNNLGHCHPKIQEALIEQSEQLWHCSNLFNIKKQNQLAKRLCDLTFADKVFFCSSGLEATEAAIKFIRKHYYDENPHKQHCKIITIKGGFHGRSIAALSAGNNVNACKSYGPLLDGFVHVARNDIIEFDRALDDSSIAGVILEPIQSEGGVHVLHPDYLCHIRKQTKLKNISLCFDEVQTGYGRTGSLFNYQTLPCDPPEMMTIAKGMGNGFPVGACLMVEKIASAIQPGSHGSTYGGNPLAMNIGNQVLEIISKPEFLKNVSINANHLLKTIKPLKSAFPKLITDIRGEGMLIGIEITSSATEIVKLCLKKKLVITKCGSDKVIRISPPLIIQTKQIEQGARILQQVFHSISTQ